MTLEEIMKAKGYTAQEISDLSPLLNNAKFRADMEAELTNGAKAVADLNNYDNWFTNEVTPDYEKIRREKIQADADLAAERARFKAYQEATMKKADGVDPNKVAAEAAEAERQRLEAERKQPQYVTAEVFQGAYEKTGEAIAKAINITSNHMQLFPGQFLDMEQLRNDARKAKMPIEDYWKKTYNVDARRTEIANKAKADAEAAIRMDERKKLMVEFGGQNPNLTPMMPSNSPFVIRKKDQATKQPWERNENEMSRDRIERAIQKAAGRGESLASA